jgi:ATP-dependent DNA helicase RecQ
VLLYAEADITDLRQNFETSFPPLDDIKKIYQCLANYYQLPVGSGKDAVYDFDLIDFSVRYGLNTLSTFNGLKQLEREGYISVSEGVYEPSTLHISVDRDTLYNYQLKNEKADIFIKLLLRSYAGLFENYIRINEKELARRMHVPVEQVTQTLNMLHSHNIVIYKPKNSADKITFLTERIDNKNLSFDKVLYNKRIDTAVDRLESMINYVKANQCRSRIILAYFGETDSYRCGKCDVCLEQNKLELSDLEFETITNELQLKLKIAETLESILGSLNYPENKLLKVIRWHVDKGAIVQKENKYEWRE